MFNLNWKKEVFTIPNFLSLFRLLLIPVYVYLYLTAETTTDYVAAGSVLALSCLPDLVDGCFLAASFVGYICAYCGKNKKTQDLKNDDPTQNA